MRNLFRVVAGRLGIVPAASVLVLSTAVLAENPPRIVGDAQPVVEMGMQVQSEGFTVEEHLARQQALSAWLKSESPAALRGSVRVEIPPEQITAIEQVVTPSGEPLKVGLVVEVTPRLDIDGLDREPSVKPTRGDARGALTPTRDGGFVWAVPISSANAGGIRVHIENMSLPANAALYLYSPAGEAYGPYTGNGPNSDGGFWTESVFGSEAILQLRLSAPVTDADLSLVSFTVTEIGHIANRFVTGLVEEGSVAASFCGNPDCIVDASCNNGTPADPAKNAVAKMEWIQGAFIYTCTGGLIADNNPSQNNFFLTANHCVSKNNTAGNVQFYWRFATSTCNGSCPSNGGWPYKTTGSSVKKTGRKGDFTLLQLNANPPAGSVFLGWNSTPVANSNGTDLWRISNPNFGPQVYSQHDVDTAVGTCSGWPRGERIYSRDITGAIDGGSSGSPVVNGSSQIVGQLSGSCGFNPSDSCANGPGEANATVDGAFAFYFSLVQPFLNP